MGEPGILAHAMEGGQSARHDQERQINTTVLTRVNNRNDQPFDPFNATPVLGVNANWNYGPLFGQAISKTAYTTPRTFRFPVGFRF